MTGAVQSLLQELLGGTFDTVTRSVTVATTATQLLKQNPDRLAYLLINLGTAQIDMDTRQSVSAGVGIPLAPGGGSLSVNWRDDFTMPTFGLWGVALAGSQTVRVIEIVRVSGESPPSG